MSEPIIIIMDGGLIHDIICADPTDLGVIIIDYDIENLDEDQMVYVPEDKWGLEKQAYVRWTAIDKAHGAVATFARGWDRAHRLMVGQR